jgi:hypothetical protein
MDYVRDDRPAGEFERLNIERLWMVSTSLGTDLRQIKI